MITQTDLSAQQIVMVPMAGPYRLEGRSELRIHGQTNTYYAYRGVVRGDVVRIPVHQLRQRGVRPLMSASQLRAALEAVLEKPPANRLNDRYRRWTELLKSGRPGVRLQVLAEMQSVGSRRLRAGELRLRDLVEANACYEIQHVLGVSGCEAERTLKKSIETAFQQLSD